MLFLQTLTRARRARRARPYSLKPKPETFTEQKESIAEML